MSDHRYEIIATFRGFRPLTILNGRVVGCRGNRLVSTDLNFSDVQVLGTLPWPTGWRRVARVARLLERVLRLQPTSAAVFFNELHLVCRNEIHRFCFLSRSWKPPLVLPLRVTALRLDEIVINGQRCLAFGEYLSNPKRNPVGVWLLRRGGFWERHEAFERGVIEHVHSIQMLGDKPVVLTGDFRSAAGFWTLNDKSMSVERVSPTTQLFRATFLMNFEDGPTFYGTDSQLDANFIVRLRTNNGLISGTPEIPLIGSVIYGARSASNWFFSTTVECGEPTGKFVRDLFDSNRGPGILSDNASAYELSRSGGLASILSATKDRYPFRLGQFGTFAFPSGTMPPGRAMLYGIGLVEYDDVAILVAKKPEI